MGVHDLVACGFAVCEVAHLRPDGACSCRSGDECPAPGKHPIGRGWLKTAIRRQPAAALRLPAYVRLAPKTSFGLIPMPGSGLIVIDRDDPAVGLPMPETFEVHRASADPRRGHYVLRLADGISEDDIPRAFAGGEVRVAGSGHIVGPGCRHKSGDLYEANGAAVGIADRDLIDALRDLRPVRHSSSGVVEAVIGSRHAWLTNQARKYRGWGWDADRIADQLRDLNDTVCTPPLTDHEFGDVLRAVDWAVKNIAPDRGYRITRRRNRRVSRHGR